MDENREENAIDAGIIDFKAKVLEIYPEAYCLKHHRRVFLIKMEGDNYTDVVRYDHDIVIDSNKGASISTSKYTEEGAWEYAWHYVEQRMMFLLEN